MMIEITSASVSKKGTVWIQAKVIDNPRHQGTPNLEVGNVYDCTFDSKVVKESKDEKAKD